MRRSITQEGQCCCGYAGNYKCSEIKINGSRRRMHTMSVRLCFLFCTFAFCREVDVQADVKAWTALQKSPKVVNKQERDLIFSVSALNVAPFITGLPLSDRLQMTYYKFRRLTV